MESVPENVKNLLMVLASSRVLVPGWSENSGGAQERSLWDLTWSKVGGISSGLNPGMLNAAGILNGGGGDMAGPAVPAVPVATNTAAAVSAPVENGSVASPPVAPAAIDPAPAPAVVEEQAAIEEEEEEEEAPPACKQS